MAEIRIENVKKEFASFRALADISLVVKDREFVALLGPSGCGKTTLLRIIAGLETQHLLHLDEPAVLVSVVEPGV